MMLKRLAIVAVLCASACAHQTAVLPRPEGNLLVVDAAPEKGFHYPYILRLPEQAGARFLLVEPNNTGRVSDDLDIHLQAAKDLSQKAIGAYVSKRLALPLLVPAFPRPQTNWELYTHQLDRDSMLIESGPMRRLDLQLIAMIDDARKRLRSYGFEVEEKVLLTGFSASGTFANRFTVIHPKRVQAVATGGLNGLVMIPEATVDSVQLFYPIGLADFQKVTGRRFDARAWKQVPQFIYMGAKDDNDALHYGDGYSDAERGVVYTAIGEKMQPDRWERGQAIYREAGANVTFRTYEHIGHGTDKKINEELLEFFRQAMTR